MAIDQVCAMAVEQGDIPHVEVDAQTLWFCSTCRDEFAADPDRFLLLSKVVAS